MGNALTKLADVAAVIASRDLLIMEARREGHTWRVIASTVGMTELAVRQAARRANGGVLPRPGE